MFAVKRIAAAAVGSGAAAAGVGIAGKAATPMLMSKLGVVVSGVGTMFEAGGVVATVQATSAALLSLPVIGYAAAGGASCAILMLLL